MSNEDGSKFQIVSDPVIVEKPDGPWERMLVVGKDRDDIIAGAIVTGEEVGAEAVNVIFQGDNAKNRGTTSFGFRNWGGSRWQPTGPITPWGHNNDATEGKPS